VSCEAPKIALTIIMLVFWLTGVIPVATAQTPPEEAKSACDGFAGSNGAWRSGGESREEAELYLSSELNESLARSHACAQELSRQDAASSTQSADTNANRTLAGGADRSNDGPSDPSMAGLGGMPNASGSGDPGSATASNEGRFPQGDAVASYPAESPAGGPDATSSASTSGGYRPPSATSSEDAAARSANEDASEGSYAAALREAFLRETDPRLRQAIEDEYRRLTGKSL
jgi:hypothetical protein